MMSSTPRSFVGPVTLRVVDVRCGHCLDAVVTALRQVPGVRTVTVDAEARLVTVTADAPVDRADLDRAVLPTGHACTAVD